MAVSTIDQLRARMQHPAPRGGASAIPVQQSHLSSPAPPPQLSSGWQQSAHQPSRPAPRLEFSSRSSSSKSSDQAKLDVSSHRVSGFLNPSILPPPEPVHPPPSLAKAPSLPSSKRSLPPAEPQFPPPVLGRPRQGGSSDRGMRQTPAGRRRTRRARADLSLEPQREAPSLRGAETQREQGPPRAVNLSDAGAKGKEAQQAETSRQQLSSRGSKVPVGRQQGCADKGVSHGRPARAHGHVPARRSERGGGSAQGAAHAAGGREGRRGAAD
eukprot:767240-Hanusia_phi.AAC.6